MVEEDGFDSDDREVEPAAVRLTFRYDGEDVQLLSLRRVRKVLSPSETRENWQDRLGSWTEVRDADGKTLDRRVLNDPVPTDAEVFPEGLGEPITRVPLDRPSGVFSVLVPDLEGADYVSLMRSTSTDREAFVGPSEVIRVPLKPEVEPPEGAGS